MTARPRTTDPAQIAAAVRAETLLRPHGAQARVARRLGVDRATVTRAMQKAPTVETLEYVPAPGELELAAERERVVREEQAVLLRQLLAEQPPQRVARTLHALPAPAAPAQQAAPAATFVSVDVYRPGIVHNVAHLKAAWAAGMGVWLAVVALVCLVARGHPELAWMLTAVCLGAAWLFVTRG